MARLQEWYRTLDQLLAHKERIEVELFARLRDLFHLEVEMVFYDLTSTYFEGRGPAGLVYFPRKSGHECVCFLSLVIRSRRLRCGQGRKPA